MADIDLTPNAAQQQRLRYVFAESVRSHAGDIRDIAALEERLQVIWDSNPTHAFKFDHAEVDWLLAGLQLLWSYKDQSRRELREAIAEIDRTTANNRAIREAGY